MEHLRLERPVDQALGKVDLLGQQLLDVGGEQYDGRRAAGDVDSPDLALGREDDRATVGGERVAWSTVGVAVIQVSRILHAIHGVVCHPFLIGLEIPDDQYRFAIHRAEIRQHPPVSADRGARDLSIPSGERHRLPVPAIQPIEGPGTRT